ncbi:hypothetical protein AN214_03916 [Pseudoalteromonas sp. P1-9]|uniref:hypothetical protein n=1 Tax=Pseudoalteromonas sp. P1-9 TaxID=1710354 RepID=UPI0006D5CFD7|nr:hypothetical protein [Pseudoalteromonas sp. P1-9]KPV94008.1 hypothetical protein AN214_03916 [Pseudoalteromonas sp. P1-9]
MRFITILLSLISFTSFANNNNYAVEHLKLTHSELIVGQPKNVSTYYCTYEALSHNEELSRLSFQGRPVECLSTLESFTVSNYPEPHGSDYIFDTDTTNVVCRSMSSWGDDGAGTYRCTITKRSRHISAPSTSVLYFKTKTFEYEVKMNNPINKDVLSCPPESDPAYTEGPIKKDNEIVGQATWCYKPSSVGDPNSKCPEPSADDIFVAGVTNGYKTHCFNNPDGTQCHIETDETGSYFMPIQYASQEVAECKEPNQDPNPDPDPTDDPDPEPSP